MNVVLLIGRVVQQPELRYTNSGKAVASFTMAVDRRSRGAEKDTDFVPVVAWDRLGEICNEYLSKGKLISIQGRLQTRTYETQDGQKRKVFEIVANEMQMLDRGERGGSGERPPGRVPAAVSTGSSGSSGGGAGSGGGDWGDSGGGFDDVGMDDIPF